MGFGDTNPFKNDLDINKFEVLSRKEGEAFRLITLLTKLGTHSKHQCRLRAPCTRAPLAAAAWSRSGSHAPAQSVLLHVVRTLRCHISRVFYSALVSTSGLVSCACSGHGLISHSVRHSGLRNQVLPLARRCFNVSVMHSTSLRRGKYRCSTRRQAWQHFGY